jgi:hypothetical protein
MTQDFRTHKLWFFKNKGDLMGKDKCAIISGILYKCDPIGIRSETNTDEYDSEAAVIAAGLDACSSEDQLTELVFATFERYFSPLKIGTKEDYRTIAQEIRRRFSEKAAN